MTIYARTDEGQQAAYSPQSAMPRKLRSLLKVIDGKTTVEVYARSLRAFGDVMGVLKSLEMAGLIAASAQPLQVGAPATNAPAASEMHLPPLGNIARQARPSQNAATQWPQSHAQAQAQETPSPYAMQQSRAIQDLEAMATMSTMSTVMAPMQASDEQRAMALRQATESMSNFVLQRIPENAFSALHEIDQITSLEQLAAILGGYAQLISGAGALGQEHLRALKQLLQDNL